MHKLLHLTFSNIEHLHPLTRFRVILDPTRLVKLLIMSRGILDTSMLVKRMSLIEFSFPAVANTPEISDQQDQLRPETSEGWSLKFVL